MAHLIDKDALVAKINELKKEVGDDEYWNGYDIALDEVLYFINSLPEEPVSEDLEEASETISLELYPKNIKTYCGPLPGGEPFEVDDNILPRQGFVRGFKAGAEWKEEQFEKNLLAACDKQKEE